LFSVRALRLFDELSEQQAASFLSGLLTATDVLAMCSAEQLSGALTLVGSGAAGNAYAHAFKALDVPYTLIDGDVAVARGLHAISRAAGLV
jgi:2-keto-3-deoxy-galactonokinase